MGGGGFRRQTQADVNRSLCEQGYERGGGWWVSGADGPTERSGELPGERRVGGAGERDDYVGEWIGN